MTLNSDSAAGTFRLDVDPLDCRIREGDDLLLAPGLVNEEKVYVGGFGSILTVEPLKYFHAKGETMDLLKVATPSPSPVSLPSPVAVVQPSPFPHQQQQGTADLAQQQQQVLGQQSQQQQQPGQPATQATQAAVQFTPAKPNGAVVEAAACLETPLAVCAGPDEMCFLDTRCSDASNLSGTHGCNAGGKGQNCRFCGFGPYAACPDVPVAGRAKSAHSALDLAGLQQHPRGETVWNKDPKSFSLPEVDAKSQHAWR